MGKNLHKIVKIVYTQTDNIFSLEIERETFKSEMVNNIVNVHISFFHPVLQFVGCEYSFILFFQLTTLLSISRKSHGKRSFFFNN